MYFVLYYNSSCILYLSYSFPLQSIIFFQNLHVSERWLEANDMIIFSRKFSKHFKMSVRIKPRFQHPNPRSYANAVEILENPVRSLVFVMPSDLTMTSQLPRVALSENAKYNKIAISVSWSIQWGKSKNPIHAATINISLWKTEK